MVSAVSSNWLAMRMQLQQRQPQKPGSPVAVPKTKQNVKRVEDAEKPQPLAGKKRRRRKGDVQEQEGVGRESHKQQRGKKQARKETKKDEAMPPRGDPKQSIPSATSHTPVAAAAPLAPSSQPPSPFSHAPKLAVLLPDSPSFDACLRHSYQGFVHDSAQAFPAELHADVEQALEEMTHRQLFHYDVVSAGKAVSSTFCERTLLGARGMTYQLADATPLHTPLPLIPSHGPCQPLCSPRAVTLLPSTYRHDS